jgi:transposase InsO family protein
MSKTDIIHYLIDPGKPAQNGKAERNHRSDQELFSNQVGFTTIEELNYKLKPWNIYHNDLQYCALGNKTPNEYLAEYIKIP